MIAEIQSFVDRMFRGEDELKSENARQYWNAIVNSGVEQANRDSQDKGIA